MSQFLIETIERAKTYQVSTWTYQDPKRFHPYALASIGYIAKIQGEVQCCLCHHTVKFVDQDQQPLELEGQLVDHCQNCVYRGEKMKNVRVEELYLNMDDLLLEIGKENAKVQAKMYPLLNSKAITEFVEEQKFTFNKVLPLYNVDRKEFQISFMLTFFGWHFDQQQEGKQPHLCCYFCGRKSSLSAKILTEVDKHSSQRQQQSKQEKLFDPVNQHRYFCPWIGGAKGWQIYLQHLYDKTNEITGFKLKSSPTEVKKMRLQIDKFVDGMREKTEGSFGKLRLSVKQLETFCERLTQDANIDISDLNIEEDVKKLKDREAQLGVFTETIHSEFQNPFKKLKLG